MFSTFLSTSASLSAIPLASSLVSGGGSVHRMKPVTRLSMESIMHSWSLAAVEQDLGRADDGLAADFDDLLLYGGLTR